MDEPQAGAEVEKQVAAPMVGAFAEQEADGELVEVEIGVGTETAASVVKLVVESVVAPVYSVASVQAALVLRAYSTLDCTRHTSSARRSPNAVVCC